MQVDTGQFRALTDQAAADRATTAAVLRHVRDLYHLAYQHGQADALGEPRRVPPRRRDHLRVIR